MTVYAHTGIVKGHLTLVFSQDKDWTSRGVVITSRDHMLEIAGKNDVLIQFRHEFMSPLVVDFNSAVLQNCFMQMCKLCDIPMSSEELPTTHRTFWKLEIDLPDFNHLAFPTYFSKEGDGIAFGKRILEILRPDQTIHVSSKHHNNGTASYQFFVGGDPAQLGRPCQAYLGAYELDAVAPLDRLEAYAMKTAKEAVLRHEINGPKFGTIYGKSTPALDSLIEEDNNG